MGIDLIAKLAKRSIIQHSQRRLISNNSISESQFVWQYQECRAYSAATKVPKTHFLSFQFFLRKLSPSSSSSSACAKTQMGFLAWYLGALEYRPIITKSISSAIIYAAADVTSQVITMEPSDSLYIIRTLRMAGFGLIILGTVRTTCLQGENGEEVAARLNRDLLPTMIKGLMYWPMCDFLTYKVIPVHLQPLINSTFSSAWTIYLMYVASLKKAAD
ncbi:hypothetical protein RND71_027696 [Anisodus tanguticus]|uniref:Uncharacterized protein n=1 Tax=Anisodus tanguticus TaxID=243964 RepID=A0AAE1V0U4_9SOLA|nr:hypothetical protein RND71_027696 [Anisodus tanguticus]